MNGRLVQRSVALFAMCIAAAGCAAFDAASQSRTLTPVEIEAIRQHQLALVVLRVTGEFNGEPIVKAGEIPVGIGRAGLDTGGAFKPAFLSGFGWQLALARRFTRDTLDAGWFFFLLEPGGTHYLAVITLVSSAAQNEEWASRAPRIRIDVPPDTPVVYAGNLHVRVSTRVSVGKTAFGKEVTIRRQVVEPGGLEVRDESALARQLASDNIGLLAPPRTALMQSTDSGTITFPTRRGEPRP